MDCSIRITRNVPMEMRDSVILRADIYRPYDRQKHPAILVRTPYERHSVMDHCFLSVVDTIPAGYALVFQNVRGTFDSGGANELGDTLRSYEGNDGYDSVEWLATQSWCDGNICMAGSSYMAMTQWTAARQNPPHLKAISPWVAGSALAEPTRSNGTICLAAGLNWVLGMAVAIVDQQEKQGKDVSSMRQLLNRAQYDPAEIYNFLPLRDVPYFNFEGIRDIWANVVLDNKRDTPEYIAKSTLDFNKIKVPCFHVTGWFDDWPGGTVDLFSGMREKGGSQLARQGQHLVMGPWDHSGPDPNGDTGDLNYGQLATLLGSQLSQYIIKFFDKYVKGMDIELPTVRYFVMGKNIWRNADTWPLSDTLWQKKFLHSRGHANTSLGDGLLTSEEPVSESSDIFKYDPHFPVTTISARGQSRLTRFASGPQEQSPIEQRDDVLCYTTPVLKEDLEITGPLKVHLFAMTSVRDTDFTARLVDVYPDGFAYNVVCGGIVRARYRKSLFQPEFVTPGEVNEYIINLGVVSQLFRQGHRIRLDISSSNFPEYDRNMNTGNLPGEDSKGIIAIQTILHDSKYPSYIDVPVIKDT